MDRLMEQYAEYEQIYARNFYHGDVPDTVLSGDGDTGYFLLTAPHAVNHYKEGRRKFADLYTGSIARLVGERTGSSWLAASGIASDFAYWDERNDPFRKTLDSFLDDGAFVIDLHGISARYGADLFIGYGTNPSDEALELAEDLQHEFSEYRVVAGGKFNATAPTTVRSYVTGRGGDGIQLELAPRLRNAEEHPDTARDFLARFGTLLNRHADLQLTPAAAAA